MKLPKILKPLILVAFLANVGVASATLTTPVLVAANSTFSDVVLGTITLGTTSNLTGTLGSIDSAVLTFGSFNFPVTFSSVTFSGSSLSGESYSSAVGGSTFSFSNLLAGVYTLKASGEVGPLGTGGGGGLIAADYNIAAVPEPETYAMLLAGLGMMGFVARRRRNNG